MGQRQGSHATAKRPLPQNAQRWREPWKWQGEEGPYRRELPYSQMRGPQGQTRAWKSGGAQLMREWQATRRQTRKRGGRQ